MKDKMALLDEKLERVNGGYDYNLCEWDREWTRNMVKAMKQEGLTLEERKKYFIRKLKFTQYYIPVIDYATEIWDSIQV